MLDTITEPVGSEVIHFQPEVQVPAPRSSSTTPLSAHAYSFVLNARVLNQNGEYNLSLNLLRQACNLQNHEVIFKEMTITLILKKSWSEALKVVNQWCRLHSGFEASYYKAQIQYELGQDDQSLQSYFECLADVSSEKRELFEIFKNVGNIYVRKGDFESAEEFYNKAYSFNNRSDILYVNYGILEMQRGDLNRAKDRFRSAIHLNSRNDRAWVSLAMVHFEFGDEDLAAANIKKAIDLNPANKTGLIFAYQKLTHKKYADFVIEAMQSYLEHNEFDEEVSCLLIQKLFEMKQMGLAILECNRLILWNPLKEEYFNLLNQLEIEQGKQK